MASPRLKQRESTGVETAPSLPKQVDVTKTVFRTWYVEALAFHERVFPEGEKGSRSLTMDAADWLDALKASPELQRLFAVELITILQEYEKDHDVANGDPLWQHQKALLIETAIRGVERGAMSVNSILMEEAPGTGKTRIQGIVLQAFTRLQARGLFEGNILILLKRKAMVLQQAYTQDERAARVLDSLSPEALKLQRRDMYRYAEQKLAHIGSFMPYEMWSAMCEKKFATVEAAVAALRKVLPAQDRGREIMALPNIEALLQDLGSLLSRTGIVIMDANWKERQLLRVGNARPPKAANGKKGDLLFGIHPSMTTSGRLFVQTSFGSEDDAVDGLSADTRIAVTSQTAWYQDRSRKKYADFLRKVGVILVDEGGLRGAHEFQQIVGHATGDRTREPFVFSATAFNRNSRYDAYLSTLTPERAINSPDHVMNPVRLSVFPDNRGDLYPTGSYEAANQLITKLLKELPLLREQNETQPTNGHHLVVVDPRLIPYVVAKLRVDTKDTGLQVIAYDTNTNEEHAAVVQVALNNPSTPPICVVGSGQAVMDSYDWVRLQSTWYATSENHASMENTRRTFGRQFHSRMKGSMIVQQRFGTPGSHNNLPWKMIDADADIPKEGPFTLIDGQYVLGDEACMSEKSAIANTQAPPEHFDVKISAKNFAKLQRKPGTFPPKKSEQQTHPFLYTSCFPAFPKGTTPETFMMTKDYAKAFAAANGIRLEEKDDRYYYAALGAKEAGQSLFDGLEEQLLYDRKCAVLPKLTENDPRRGHRRQK